MSWWTKALYDTCSLITLDKLLLDQPGMEAHFHEAQALDESFTADQMRPDTAERMRARTTILALPDPVVRPENWTGA
jgi:hypothetical protein